MPELSSTGGLTSPDITTSPTQPAQVAPLPDIDAGLLSAFASTQIAPAEVGAPVQPEGSFGSSFATGLEDFSAGVSIYNAVDEIGHIQVNRIDPSYIANRDEMIASDEELSKRFSVIAQAAATDHGAAELLNGYYGATNMDVARDILVRQWDNLQDIQRRAKEDGGLGYWLGAASGLGLDLVVLAPLTGGMGTLLGTSSRVAAVASRGAAIATIDATIDSIARNEWDKSFTLGDAALSIGLSSVVGGSLGGVIGKLQNRPVSRPALERGLADAIDQMEADRLVKTGDSASAAKVGDNVELDDISTTEVADLDLGLANKPVVRQFSSPKQRMKNVVDTIADAAEQTGRAVAARVFNRIFNLTGRTDQSAKGIKSSRTMEDGTRLMRDELRAHRTKIDDLDKKLVRDLYGKGALARHMKMGVPDRNVRRSQGDQLAVSRANLESTGEKLSTLNADLDKVNASIKKSTDGNTKGLERHKKYLEEQVQRTTTQFNRAESAVEEVEESIRLQARGDGIDEDGYLKGIEAIAELDSDHYFTMGQRAQSVGLLPEKTPIRRGYRMQSWNPEAVKAYEGEFRGLLLTTLFNSPQPEFIAKYTDADNLDDVFKADPELAARIQEDWHDAIIELAEDEADSVIRAAEWKHGVAFDDAYHSLMARHYEKAQDFLKEAEELTEQLDEIRWSVNGEDYGSSEVKSQVNRLVRQIGRKEYAARMRMQKHDDMKSLLGQSLEMEDFVRANAREARAAGIQVSSIDRSLTRTRTRAAATAEKIAAKSDVRKLVDDIVKSISGQKSINPFEAEDFVQTSKHFKARGLDLTGFHHLPSTQKFMNQGSDDLLNGYTESVNIQVQLEDKFGAFLRNAGYLDKGDHKVADALESYVDDAFKREQNRLTPDSPEHLKLVKERENIMGLLRGSLQEFTRADRSKQLSIESNQIMDRTTGMISTFMSMTLLNRAVLSALGDLQSMASGSGRFVMPIVPMFKQLGRVMGSDLKDADMAQWVAIRGSSVLDQAEFGNRFDPEMTPHYAGGGTYLRSMQLKLEDANVYAQWANMSTPWTLFVRKVAGTEAAKFIRDDALKGWDKLSKGVQEAYASAGIDKADLEAISALAKSSGTIKDGATKLTDTSKWDQKFVVREADGKLRVVDADGPIPVNAVHGRTLRETYLNGINRLAAQMHLDPAMGDRPFWMRNPMGRMFSAFQSFTYAAAERFVWPMVQDMKMNHAQSRYLYAMAMGIGLSAINVGARDVLDGRDSATRRLLMGDASGEDVWVALQTAVRRSPLMVGQLSQILEGVQGIAGKAINDATGLPVFPPESVKYRHGQGLAGLVGPLPGTLSRVDTIAKKFADGDVEEGLTGMSKMTPFVGAIYSQLLLQYMTEN